MKRLLVIFLSFWTISLMGQIEEDYCLETEMRNPIDTSAFRMEKTILLFVHSCDQNDACPTRKMQQAFETDSLGIRNELGIQLYVIYPHYSSENIKEFYSFTPNNVSIAFYTNEKYRGVFGENKEITPCVVFFDGKGHSHIKEGGTYADIYSLLKGKWRYMYCSRCYGTGCVTPNRYGGPDESVGICPRCGGRGYLGTYY